MNGAASHVNGAVPKVETRSVNGEKLKAGASRLVVSTASGETVKAVARSVNGEKLKAENSTVNGQRREIESPGRG